MPSTLETPRLRLRPRDGRDAAWNLALLAEHPPESAPRAHDDQQVELDDEQVELDDEQVELDDEQVRLDDEQLRLDEQRRRFDEVGFGLYTVELAETGEAAGYCGLIVGRASAAQPELAYELLRAHVGNGYATEAAGVVAEAAFEAGFPVVWATVETWNAPSFGVLAKLGFTTTRRVSGDGRKVLVWMRRRAPRRRHREAPAAAG
ncbi:MULTISPECIES: GNAT family N-acetyltransferase [unclassified Leifsonia]|uniref:GNAT family N-acetyltransferase n=1 Tax=unclassified Leifsonia TaxID=2663824 RepID=UPI001FCD6CC9|nr:MULTISPECIES: GNAT family N-acetyltransferase [unclassified Leifsonia]